MTFPLGSLGGAGRPCRRHRAATRDRRAALDLARAQSALLAGAALWLLALLALATHDAADPAFTTSGTGGALHNRAGLAGPGSPTWRCSGSASPRGGGSRSGCAPGSRRSRDCCADHGSGQGAAGRASSWLFWIGVRAPRGGELCARVVAPVPVGGAPSGSRGRRRRLPARAGEREAARLCRIGRPVDRGAARRLSLAFRFPGSRSPNGSAPAWRRARAACRAAIEREEDVRLGEQALREREQVVEVGAPAARGTPADRHRAAGRRGAPVGAGAPRSARSRSSSNWPTRSCRRSTCSTRRRGAAESVSPTRSEMTSRLIEKKLSDFGVEVRVVAASPGPVITRYEIEPATGVKGAQVVNLAKDLARSLSLVSIRVVETIPGKTTMALELPNARRQTIRLSEILASQAYNDAASQLTIGLGKDIVGNPMVADLAKMPHCLVAGTTGSGKSVGINAMILSLLYKAEARDVRLILIDPKMLEMSVYEGIPHLLARS